MHNIPVVSPEYYLIRGSKNGERGKLFLAVLAFSQCSNVMQKRRFFRSDWMMM